ncbi:uncharacterized protein LOC132736691 [Ruditapes philippinarum]|uniref:uncharacterized protein LOC132736691 n=1 Tax=Ruditapes philippinarum TaxID=129788 RepID=UPI00295AC26E|nr:uncharacterized protein LOC132736691 [Ruditapes philippinarum]
MDLKWIINFIFMIYINKASLRPRIVYKPTEFPYSRCTEHSTNGVTCEKLNISKERQEKKSFWPPGPYAIPMSKYGCPESWSRGWLKSFLKINMNVLASSLEKRNSTVLDYNSLFVDSAFFTPPFQSGDVKLYFCVKFRNEATLDQEQWIPGDYSIYKIGSSCPTDFEESSKTLPVTSLVSYGLVPNITVPKGSSEEFINISMCKRTNFTDTGDNNKNVTFKMLETDFILEKDLDSNCTHFDDVSTVFQGDMHCFYNPNVVEFDYESLTELVLEKGRLSKLHQGRT